jgi:hypothetical protein
MKKITKFPLIILTSIVVVWAIFASWTDLTSPQKQAWDKLFSNDWNAMQTNLWELKTNIGELFSTLVAYAVNWESWKEDLTVISWQTLSATLWNDTQSNIDLLKQKLIEIENNATIEVFWDENSEAITACNTRVKNAVWSQYVANDWWNWANWIWVPARHFVTDWNWLPLNNDYYKRPIKYNWTNYICKWFAVMKYEASNATSKPVSNYATASRVNITQTDAISACRNLWGTYTEKWEFHLTTNNEWMAMARNIEQQSDNYSNWVLCNWNVTWNDYTIVPANNDATELTRACTSTATDNRRVLKLSNGAVIWDLSWNSWEHVNKANTINWANYNELTTKVAWDCTNDNWTAAPWCWVAWKASVEEMAKYWPAKITTWTAWWAGNLFYADWVANNISLRGGVAHDGANTGVFALTLHWGTSDSASTYVGFRCVL